MTEPTPKDHVKPTKEELEANILKTLDEASKPPVEEPKPTPSKPPEPEPEPSKSPAPTKEEPKKEEKPPIKPVVDYKKKFVESTREAQVLFSKDKKMNEAIDQAANLPEPTDEEMITANPDWDVLSDFEKRLAKDNEFNKRKFDVLYKASQASKPIAEWYDKVDKFIEDPKVLIANPKLEGKQEEFKIFATKPTRRGVDFDDLVKAFLYDVEKAEAAKPKNKGEMFPKGSGGPPTLEKSNNKISNEELTNIRNNNYKMYKEKLQLIKEGKLELEAIE